MPDYYAAEGASMLFIYTAYYPVHMMVFVFGLLAIGYAIGRLIKK